MLKKFNKYLLFLTIVLISVRIVSKYKTAYLILSVRLTKNNILVET